MNTASRGPSARKILVVDDEPDILMSLQRLIEAALPNVRVVPASSGKAGLQLLDGQAFDLVVSDMRMPEMDGLAFLRAAQQRHPEIPRLMLTAFAEEETGRKAVSDSVVTDFIPKGTRPDELLRRLADHLAGAAATSR